MAHCVLFVQYALWISAFTTAKLVFVEQPKSMGIRSGTDVVLNCVAKDDTNPQAVLLYSWHFYNQLVQDFMPRTSVYMNHSLYIPNIKDKEFGLYTCRVQNHEVPPETITSNKASILGPYIDRFALHPEGGIVHEHNTTVLECITGQSRPPAVTHWEKDGTPYHLGNQTEARYGDTGLGGAEQKSMQLAFVATPSQAGVYRCVAQNSGNGLVFYSNPATISVLAQPQIPYISERVPPDLFLSSGQDYVYDCLIRGNPPPQIIWYKDGRPVTNTSVSSMYMLVNGSLFLAPVQPNHSGRYACVGTNTHGSVATLSTNVSVAYLELSFLQLPQDVTAVAGQSAVISCRPPKSYPSASVQWYHGTSLLEPRQGERALVISSLGDLQLSNVQLQDDGAYTCVAVNQFSIPSSRNAPPVTLTIHGSPVILEPPVPKRITKGDLLLVTCRVQGNPAPSIAWFKDKSLILPGINIDFRSRGQELLLLSVARPDEGLYHCRASNVYGTVLSSPVLIDVLVPPEIISSPAMQTVSAGVDITVPCRAYGDPEPLVTWYRDNQRLVLPSGDHMKKTDVALVINNVSKQDEGSYKCIASNEAGEKSAEAFITVQVGPVMTYFPSDMTVNKSATVYMFCDAAADPPAAWSWTFNGSSAMPTGVTLSEDLQTLTITEAQVSHSGEYACTASNMEGTARRRARLFVQEQPKISHINGTAVVNQGGLLDLYCMVMGRPAPVVTWFHDSTPLHPTPDLRVVLPAPYRLQVKFVMASDSGQYRCHAVNAAGVDDQHIKVFVPETPLAPFLDQAVAVSTTSVRLSWVATAQPAYTEVERYVVQYKPQTSLVFGVFRDDVPVSVTQLEVTGLVGASRYMFRVAARNQVGAGEYSSVLSATTLASAPGPPVDITVLESSAFTVTLKWRPPVTTSRIQRYQLQYHNKFSDTEVEYTPVDILTLTSPWQQYTLQGLIPFTTYSVRVRCATLSQEGAPLWGELSADIDVSTLTAVPSQAPRRVLLVAGTQRALRVSWQPIPSQYHHGYLRGFVVQYWWMQTPQDIKHITIHNSTVMDTNIEKLLPWQHYGVQVAGYNDAGTGVFSEVQQVRTLAQAPSGVPNSVSLSVPSPTEIKVTWQAVDRLERNSDLSGYVVWYMTQPDEGATSDYVNSPSLFEHTIRGLQPWTVYYIQIQAFTTQVPQGGYGPLTLSQAIRTPQDVPGVVTNVTSVAGADGVRLSWQPPDDANGIIEAYIVIIKNMDEIVKLNAKSRQRRSEIDINHNGNGGGQRQEVGPSTRGVRIGGLVPGGSYHIGVAARTRVGVGSFHNITVAVPPVATADPSPVTITTTEAVVTTEPPIIRKQVLPYVEKPQQGLTRGELIGVILGGVLGGLLLLALVIVICILCCRRSLDRRQDSSGHQMMQETTTDTDSPSSIHKHRPALRVFPPGQGHNSGSTSNTDYPNSSSTGRTPAPAPPPRRAGTVAHGYQPPTPAAAAASGVHCSHDTRMSSPSSKLYFAYLQNSLRASLDFSRLSSGWHTSPMYTRQKPWLCALPRKGDVFTLAYPRTGLPEQYWQAQPNTFHYGMENSGFESEGVITRSSSSSLQPFSPQLPPVPVSSTRHSKHMPQNVALAIASQRNRETSVFHDVHDTDALIENESVVVYNERTAL